MATSENIPETLGPEEADRLSKPKEELQLSAKELLGLQVPPTIVEALRSPERSINTFYIEPEINGQLAQLDIEIRPAKSEEIHQFIQHSPTEGRLRIEVRTPEEVNAKIFRRIDKAADRIRRCYALIFKNVITGNKIIIGYILAEMQILQETSKGYIERVALHPGAQERSLHLALCTAVLLNIMDPIILDELHIGGEPEETVNAMLRDAEFVKTDQTKNSSYTTRMIAGSSWNNDAMPLYICKVKADETVERLRTALEKAITAAKSKLEENPLTPEKIRAQDLCALSTERKPCSICGIEVVEQLQTAKISWQDAIQVKLTEDGLNKVKALQESDACEGDFELDEEEDTLQASLQALPSLLNEAAGERVGLMSDNVNLTAKTSVGKEMPIKLSANSKIYVVNCEELTDYLGRNRLSTHTRHIYEGERKGHLSFKINQFMMIVRAILRNEGAEKLMELIPEGSIEIDCLQDPEDRGNKLISLG